MCVRAELRECVHDYPLKIGKVFRFFCKLSAPEIFEGGSNNLYISWQSEAAAI